MGARTFWLKKSEEYCFDISPPNTVAWTLAFARALKEQLVTAYKTKAANSELINNGQRCVGILKTNLAAST